MDIVCPFTIARIRRCVMRTNFPLRKVFAKGKGECPFDVKRTKNAGVAIPPHPTALAGAKKEISLLFFCISIVFSVSSPLRHRNAIEKPIIVHF